MSGPEHLLPATEPQRALSKLAMASVELSNTSDLGSFHSCELWVDADGQRHDAWETETLQGLVQGAVNDTELLS